MLKDTISPVVVDMIKEFGSTVILKKKASSTYNPATGKVETTEGATITLKGLIESYSSDEVQGLIQVGDIKLMIANDETTLFDLSSDKVVFNSVEYNIINIEPEILQDKIMFYLLQVRR